MPTSFPGSYLFSPWEEIKSWERGWHSAWPIALRILGTRLHDLSLLLLADQKMFRVNGSSRAVRFIIGCRELETSDVFTKICRKRQLFWLILNSYYLVERVQKLCSKHVLNCFLPKNEIFLICSIVMEHIKLLLWRVRILPLLHVSFSKWLSWSIISILYNVTNDTS